ncbi:hypothetical protein B0H19DRAFT_954458 [Mycena capillaripes]|nr:hypothetical protein B0H19DRAFT_954458 [Mycena capillaripes]
MSIPYLLNPLPIRPIRRRGKKPVIYLFSPEDINACVKLSLIPTWSFSSVYPVVPIETSQSGREAVEWNVRTQADGNLTELQTELEVSYLFWEAEARAESTLVPNLNVQFQRTTLTGLLNPASCNLSDVNAVLLTTSSAVPYLNTVLQILGLHTEARTSFITFWLPSFLRHKHIALRFLPQSMYRQAAPLSVDPEPDVVARIFMVFTGVADKDRSQWGSADLRAQDVTYWKDVVGVEEMRMKDKRLFRILEWGGMEI